MALYYVGLDYHLHTSTLVMLDENGRTVEERTLRGHWSRAVAWLSEQAAGGRRLRVCFEASCGYGVLHDQLSAVAQVTVVHPGRVRLIFKSKRKNDRIDAAKLAKLLYLGEAPAVHVPKPRARAWREMVEFRRQKVDHQTRIKSELRALLRGQGVQAPKGLWTKKSLAWLRELAWASDLAAMRRDILMEELASIGRTVDRVTRELDKIAAGHAGVRLLMTIPGVGPRTAEAVVAYIDDPHRFTRTRSIGAYFGLVPCQDSSAGVNRLGHITKQGPATARKLLTEAAWHCTRLSPEMRAFFDRVTGGKKERRKIAIIAVAHKLPRIMLAMLKSGQAWDQQRLRLNPAAAA